MKPNTVTRTVVAIVFALAVVSLVPSASAELLHRFGGRFGWYRGVAAERSAVKSTSTVTAGTLSETTIEAAPEPSPSCSQVTDGQFAADHSQSEENTFVGHCARAELGHLLTGQCSGYYLNQPRCGYINDEQQCPRGAKVIKPSAFVCHYEFFSVDAARSCSH